MHPPLLVTSDTALLDDVLRLAAAAGVVLDVAHDPTSALRFWQAAPLVLVGPDLAAAVAAEVPPRRPGVHLLTRSEPDYRTAVALGAAAVVELPDSEPWLVEAMAEVGEGRARSAVTIGFVGGSGGVGATTLACAVAQVAAVDRPVAILDLDPLGPGVERVVGLDVAQGIRWSDLGATQGRLGSRALRESLPRRGELAVLGYGVEPAGLESAVAREVLAAAQRGHDLVVLDLPRHLAGAAEQLVARCDLVVLVAGCSVPGAAAAARTLGALTPMVGDVRLAARTHQGAVTGTRLASTLGLRLVAEVGHQRTLAEHLDLGLGPLHARRGPVARAAAALVEGLT